MVNPTLQVINEDTWRSAVDYAMRSGDYEKLNQLKQIADLVQPNGVQPRSLYNQHGDSVVTDIDPRTGERTLRINVIHMVANYVGPGFEIQVTQEKWDEEVFSSRPGASNKHLVVINLRKAEDNPDCEIITLREPFSQFPSLEMRAKLELLRYK